MSDEDKKYEDPGKKAVDQSMRTYDIMGKLDLFPPNHLMFKEAKIRSDF